MAVGATEGQEVMNKNYPRISPMSGTLKSVRKPLCSALLAFAALAQPLAGVGVHAQQSRAKDDAKTQSAKASKEKSATPALDAFAQNLTEEARRGAFVELNAHRDAVRRLESILAQNGAASAANPLLAGEAVGGRIALVRELARRIATGEAGAALRDKQIYSLDAAALQDKARSEEEVNQRLFAVFADA